MPRNKDLVSDSERETALIEIVEFAKDIIIRLKSGSYQCNYVSHDTGNSYQIVLSSPTVKGIERFTALNHECCHLLFDSPAMIVKELINEWCWIDGKGADGKPNIDKLKAKMFFHVWNVLEDVRIESQGGKIWLGTKKRFEKARTKRGEILTEEEKDQGEDFYKNLNKTYAPPDLLLMIRFNQENRFKENPYLKEMKQSISDVEFTSRDGAIIVLTKLKPTLEKWWEERVNKYDTYPRFKWEHSYSQIRRGDSIDGNRGNGSLRQPNETHVAGKVWLKDRLGQKEVGELLKDEKESGDNDIEELKSTLDIISKDMSDSIRDVEVIKRKPAKIEKHNVIVSKHLRKLFNNITAMPKSRINNIGDEIDIGSYIERKIDGYDLNRCLIHKKNEVGLSVLISIDGSGSMRSNDRIDKARELVRTLFESVKDIENVEIKAQVWSSDKKGIVGITNINNKKETNMITLDIDTNKFQSRFKQTPTHKALTLASREVKHMKGKKKLIVMITDGYPNYSKNLFKIPTATMVKMTRKSLIKALRVSPNIMCVLVGDYNHHTSKLMREVFTQKRLVHVESMDEANEKVIKKFKDTVVRVLK